MFCICQHCWYFNTAGWKLLVERKQETRCSICSQDLGLECSCFRNYNYGIWTDPGAHLYPSNVFNISIHVLEITEPLLNIPLCSFMSTGGHPGQGDEIMARPSGRLRGEQLLPLPCCTFPTESNLVNQAVLILIERSKLRIFYFWSTSSGWSVHPSNRQYTGSNPSSAPGMQEIYLDKIPIKCSSVHKLWVNCNTRVSWTWE